MAIVVAKLTEDALKYWPQLFGGLMGDPSTTTVPGVPPTSWDPRIKFFKVGEGGWMDPGSGRVRRTPVKDLRRLSSPLIQDLDCVVDATRALIDQRYASDERATFKKDLTAGDFSFTAPSTIEIQCLLDFAEFNDDGDGNDPEIWEIGIFMDHPEVGSLDPDEGLMIAYGTVDEQIKNAGKQILNVVRIVAGGS